jgi:hypothetical protein
MLQGKYVRLDVHLQYIQSVIETDNIPKQADIHQLVQPLFRLEDDTFQNAWLARTQAMSKELLDLQTAHLTQIRDALEKEYSTAKSRLLGEADDEQSIYISSLLDKYKNREISYASDRKLRKMEGTSASLGATSMAAQQKRSDLTDSAAKRQSRSTSPRRVIVSANRRTDFRVRLDQAPPTNRGQPNREPPPRRRQQQKQGSSNQRGNRPQGQSRQQTWQNQGGNDLPAVFTSVNAPDRPSRTRTTVQQLRPVILPYRQARTTEH